MKIASAFPPDLDEDAGRATMPDIRPWGERAAWVSLPQEGRVVLVDLEHGEVLRSVVTGGMPTRLAWLFADAFSPEAFSKEASFSRSAFASFLLHLAEPDWAPPAARSGTGPRVDVPADHPAALVVEAVLARGWMQGEGATFAPDRAVTREEAAVALKRAFAIPDVDVSKAPPLADGGSVAPWAQAAVRSLVAKVPGVVDETGRFYPRAPVDAAWLEIVREALVGAVASEASLR